MESDKNSCWSMFQEFQSCPIGKVISQRPIKISRQLSEPPRQEGEADEMDPITAMFVM